MALLPSKTRKGFGYKRETGNITTDSLGKLKLDVHEIPREFIDHQDGLATTGILDQGATSSCVAHAFAAALHLAEVRAGLSFVPVSRLFIYYNARREHLGHLLDAGTYLRTAAAGLRKMGAPDETLWRFGQLGTRVNRRPNWNAMRFAHARRSGRYVRIYEQGADRVRAIQQALLNGHDVAFGTLVSEEFLSPQGPPVIRPPAISDKIVGGHAMLIIGWCHIGSELYFRVLNSWGAHWRDHGLCWMHEDYIRWSRTSDLHVVHGWNRLTEEAA